MSAENETPCEHDLAERETACADGICPICLRSALSAANAERDEYQGYWQQMLDKADKLYEQLADAEESRDTALRELEEAKLELSDMTKDYLRRHKDAADRFDEVIALNRELEEARKLCFDWSTIRSILAQGASIQQDYMAGKYQGYEHYSARLDEAARERLPTDAALK